MGLITWVFNRNKIENPAKINIKTIKKFLQGTYYKLLLKIPLLKDKLVSRARQEQIVWRRNQVQVKSPECFKKGECFCGCDVEGLISADAACTEKNLCFPEMMNAAEWEIFKKENNIKL